jgi:tetratricopeptide (TPR) repeat protein
MQNLVTGEIALQSQELRFGTASSKLPAFWWVLAFLLAWLPARAAEKPWTEVRSPHFRVLTDGSDKDARRAAREFEQMRVALNEIFPHIRLDSGAPLLVLAVRDEDSMKALAPGLWKQKGAKPAGYFHHGWDKEFAVVQLNQDQPGSYQVVYHEYVHTIMHLNLRWLPLWLDEGFADFYGNTRMESKRLIVGAPERRVAVLRGRSLIPLTTLLDVTHTSPYYHDEDKVQMFYAESWALTHYLTFGPGMEKGKKMLQFANLLQQGGNQKKTFEEVFGDIQRVERNLDNYLSQPAVVTGILNNPPQIDEKDFTARKLTEAETEAELGSFHLWQHEVADARRLTEQALQDDPKLGLAHETMGFIDFIQGKDAEAVGEFGQAVQLDGKLYLSEFAFTMLSPSARSDDPGAQSGLHEALLKTLDLNPQFAPAYVQLARLYVRQGNLESALGVSRKAEQLEPARAGYHIQSGQILLRMGRGAEAAGFAKYVADRWIGPDHDEAVELWNSVPPAQRPAGELAPTPAPEGTQIVEGRVKLASCGSKDERTSFVVEQGGQLLRFIAKGGFRGGFSDTLWYGEDHFSFCRHVEGLRAVVRYRPSADNAYAGELAEFDLRDDLPPPASSKTEDPKAAAKP